MEKGDKTVVADRGLNLSKGQQARVNLARAVYRESDIYLIDDALTALDSSVQQQIFKDCVKVFLKDKLVVLVTHNAQHIEEADKLVILDDGQVKFEGAQKEVTKQILEAMGEELVATKPLEKHIVEEKTNEKTKLLPPNLPRKRAIYYEKKKQGKVELSVYTTYLKSGGGILLILLIAATHFASTFTDSTSQKMLTKW